MQTSEANNTTEGKDTTTNSLAATRPKNARLLILSRNKKINHESIEDILLPIVINTLTKYFLSIGYKEDHQEIYSRLNGLISYSSIHAIKGGEADAVFLIEANANNNDVDILRQIELMSKYKVIVVAKPTIPFNKLDKYLIDQYIMNGGKVLWLIDGVSAKTDSLQKNNFFIASSNNLNLDDQLFKYGLRINSNLIEDLRSTKIPIVTGFSNNIPQQSLFAWPYYPLLFSKSNHSRNYYSFVLKIHRSFFPRSFKTLFI